jgi:hypothetical protein
MEKEKERKVEKVKDAEETMQVHRLVLDVRAGKKSQQEDDWQKAHVLSENKLLSKKKTEARKVEGDKEPAGKAASLANLKKEGEAAKPNYVAWYVVYFFLTIGLLAGMKYMHDN